MTDLDAALFAAVSPRGYSVRNQIDEVRGLVDAGADVMARGATGQTPLHAAVRSPQLAFDPLPDPIVVEYLLDHGADIHATDGVGVTPIGRALALNAYRSRDKVERSIDLLRLLLSRGARLEPFPRTALPLGGGLAHLLRCADVGTFAFVAEQVGGFDLTETDADGNTPLHAVVGANRPALVELLLEWGAATDAVNRAGQTPLAVAIWKASFPPSDKMVSLLAAVNAPAGLPPRFAGGIPRPVDPVALAEAVPALPDKTRLRGIVAEGAPTYQELVVALARGGGLDAASWIIAVGRLLLDDDPQDWRLPADQAPEVSFVHHGDLLIRGHLLVTAPFVVTGSLMVTGCLELRGPDALLAVAGDVRADVVYTEGLVHIDGALRADKLVYGHGRDGALVANSVTAVVIVSDGHPIDAQASGLVVGPEQWPSLAEVFPPAFFVDDGHGPELSPRLLFDHLRWRESWGGRQPWLKSTWPPKPPRRRLFGWRR